LWQSDTVEVRKEPDLPVVDFIQASTPSKRNSSTLTHSKKSKKQKLSIGSDTNTTPEAEVVPSEGPKVGFTSALETILSKPIEVDVPILPFEAEVDKLTREDKKTQKIQKNKKEQQRLLWDKDHVKLTSEIENWEEEKRLKKIATKGVVQLFNAVSQHQKLLKKEKNKDKYKKELTKEKFLELLQKDKQIGQPTPNTPQMETDKDKKPSKWGVLSDDYLMGLKGWKDEEEDSEKDEEDSSEDDQPNWTASEQTEEKDIQ